MLWIKPVMVRNVPHFIEAVDDPTGTRSNRSRWRDVAKSVTYYTGVGGIMDHGFDWVIANGGIDTEAHYSYHAKKGECDIQRENRHVVTIDGYRDGASTLRMLEASTLCSRRALNGIFNQFKTT